MIETWFCSDHHFGHSNILEFEKEARPFINVQEMHEVIIERHNSVVKEHDIVYFLGDFAFGKQNIDIAARLNGKKKLVMGNHDTYPSADYLKYFDKLYGVIYWERCILSHVPVHHAGLGDRWLINVHGHLHSKNVKNTPDSYDLRFFNVSLEQNNLTPIHRDTILNRVREIKR